MIPNSSQAATGPRARALIRGPVRGARPGEITEQATALLLEPAARRRRRRRRPGSPLGLSVGPEADSDG